MIKSNAIYLNEIITEDKESALTDNINLKLSYNAKFTSFKHRGKIESLRFFIV